VRRVRDGDGRGAARACPARASYGPETCAQAANLVSGHHIPIYRATVLLCELAGVAVSTGWMAGIRGRAAALVEASGFTGRVRELLKAAAAVHADETRPARRAAPGTCTWPTPTT
jgi:Transposase IS66 family